MKFIRTRRRRKVSVDQIADFLIDMTPFPFEKRRGAQEKEIGAIRAWITRFINVKQVHLEPREQKKAS